MAMLNAFLLLRCARHTDTSYLQFQEVVVKALIFGTPEGEGPSTSGTEGARIVPGQHFPGVVPPTGKKGKPQKSVWNEEANCTILQTDIMDDWIDCSFTCGVDCHGQSKYPCLQILVNVSGSDYVAALHYNEEAVQINPKCFYVPQCQRDKNDLLDGVLDVKLYFERKNDTPFACFHRPDSKPEDVILIKKYDRTVVFHCLFWPTLMLIGGASIVGMVKLTQHLSLLCMLYCNSPREEHGSMTPRADSQQSRTRKDDKTLRWRSNSRTTSTI
ncbi:unnamed protein product [Ranitomeya imitator]|uniref:Uncharacterized protein n=1 Tax=Ranitomeya imitator TaxID=111125 RepID=A0ABN9M762_9NEOB|nr:unnamed protein product [Ranitomeya imitator]